MWTVVENHGHRSTFTLIYVSFGRAVLVVPRLTFLAQRHYIPLSQSSHTNTQLGESATPNLLTRVCRVTDRVYFSISKQTCMHLLLLVHH